MGVCVTVLSSSLKTHDKKHIYIYICSNIFLHKKEEKLLGGVINLKLFKHCPAMTLMHKQILFHTT